MHAQPTAVLLLSQSPRRKELLQSGGLTVHTCPMDAPEDAQGASPELQAVAIAQQKMAAFERALTLQTSAAVAALTSEQLALPRVAADTLVVLGTQRLGKPADSEAAAQMLRALSGVTHQVITGVVLRQHSAGQMLQQTLAVVTQVRFRALTEAQVQAYVATGEPFDKAGGYGIQGLGGHLVQEVHGSLTNVIGLPLAETLAALHNLPAQKTAM